MSDCRSQSGKRKTCSQCRSVAAWAVAASCEYLSRSACNTVAAEVVETVVGSGSGESLRNRCTYLVCKAEGSAAVGHCRGAWTKRPGLSRGQCLRWRQRTTVCGSRLGAAVEGSNSRKRPQRDPHEAQTARGEEGLVRMDLGAAVSVAGLDLSRVF